MARVRLTFRQRDVTAAIKAAEAAGHTVARVEISKEGSIIVELAPPAGSKTTPDLARNPFDKVYDEGYEP